MQGRRFASRGYNDELTRRHAAHITDRNIDHKDEKGKLVMTPRTRTATFTEV